jgi:hypothetical protein
MSGGTRQGRSHPRVATYFGGGLGRCSFDIASLQPALTLSELLRRHIIASCPFLSAHRDCMSAAQDFLTASRAACSSGEGAGGVCACTAAADRSETTSSSELSFMKTPMVTSADHSKAVEFEGSVAAEVHAPANRLQSATRLRTVTMRLKAMAGRKPTLTWIYRCSDIQPLRQRLW